MTTSLRAALPVLPATIVVLAACDRALTAPTPLTAAAGPSFTHVVAGGMHSCALTTAGAAYCWGLGGAGALGTDSLASVLAPTAVAAAGLAFATLTAGSDDTCGIATSGESYCWGRGDFGQLGDGARRGSVVPVRVAGGLAFAQLSAGGDHTCAVTKAGSAYCWGRGDNGERGTGALADTAAPADAVAESGYPPLSEVVTGLHHSCGLATDGSARCWGWNPYGQLGVGGNVGLGAPIPVRTRLRFAGISAGREHTCALTTGERVYCWGHNAFGQLGDGTTTDSNVPVPVSGDLGFREVDTGGSHTCAVTPAGAAYCWGSNSQGQLGSGGGPGIQTTPVPVAGRLRFLQLATGGRHTCGVSSDGAVYCWGFGGFGQLGNGAALDRDAPVRVRFP